MKNEKDIVYVYSLCDPTENEIRYIGWSSNPSTRYRQHIKEAKSGKMNHRCNWIRSLLGENLYPLMTVIESVSYKDVWEREKYWIKFYGRDSLVNGTDGGEGVLGHVPSDATRKHFSEKYSGEGNPFYGKHHSEETIVRLKSRKPTKESIEKMRKSKQGQKVSQNTKNKLKETWKLRGHPFTGRTHGEETKKKISSAKVGKIAWNKGLKTNASSPKRGIKGLGKSKYAGVSKKGEGFSARVGKDNERLYLYSSNIESDNATAYDIGAIYLYGKTCELNFPDLREEYISYLSECNVSNGKELIQAVRNYIERKNHGR